MNLKEAKEHLEKNGYKIQRLNECGFSSGGSCSGWGSSTDDDDNSSRGSSFSSRRNGCSGYSEPRRPSFARRSNLTTLRDIAGATNSRTSNAAKNALLQDLIKQIPDDQIEALIQLLKLLKSNGK